MLLLLPTQLLLPSPPSSSPPSSSTPSLPPLLLLPPTLPPLLQLRTRSPSPLISTSQINPLYSTPLLPSSRSSAGRVLLPSLFLFLSLSLPGASRQTLFPFFLHTLTLHPSLSLAFSSHSHKPQASSHFYLYTRLPSFVSSRFDPPPLSYHSASYTRHITLLNPSLTSGTDYVNRNSPSSLYNNPLRPLLNTATRFPFLFFPFYLFSLFYTLIPTPSAPPPLAPLHTYSTLPSFYSFLRSLLILNWLLAF